MRLFYHADGLLIRLMLYNTGPDLTSQVWHTQNNHSDLRQILAQILGYFNPILPAKNQGLRLKIVSNALFRNCTHFSLLHKPRVRYLILSVKPKF